MTLAYSQINFFDALYVCARAYPGGVEALSSRFGMPSSTLYQKLRPGVKTHKMTLDEAVQLLEWCQEAGVPETDAAIDAFNWRFNRISFELPKVTQSGEQLVNHLLMVMRSDGELAKDLQLALVDDRISTREMGGLEKRVQVATESLLQLLELLKEKHKKDSPRDCFSSK